MSEALNLLLLDSELELEYQVHHHLFYRHDDQPFLPISTIVFSLDFDVGKGCISTSNFIRIQLISKFLGFLEGIINSLKNK